MVQYSSQRNMKNKSPVSRSGRFAREVSADVAQFTESISFDWRLWRHDILGSLAHAEMLQKIGVLKQNELHAIVRGLDQIGKEIKAGKFKWKPELEDVHMNIEAELTKRILDGKANDRIFVVTSGLHMKRALQYFRHFGLILTPVASDYVTAEFTVLPSSQNLAIADIALHQYAGMVRLRVYNALGLNK